ncbi:hypothetical protein KC19_VG192800 [Ceratodon purpureus]|uniref:Uncharacterized protein n=1 Tax=Ceratodon purpureus TaxID=3225 RepID=A0A8T0HRP8_CERPU|nr:hypothetical protein KC19_VG192800 [Ceratodon purpureus]
MNNFEGAPGTLLLLSSSATHPIDALSFLPGLRVSAMFAYVTIQAKRKLQEYVRQSKYLFMCLHEDQYLEVGVCKSVVPEYCELLLSRERSVLSERLRARSRKSPLASNPRLVINVLRNFNAVDGWSKRPEFVQAILAVSRPYYNCVASIWCRSVPEDPEVVCIEQDFWPLFPVCYGSN